MSPANLPVVTSPAPREAWAELLRSDPGAVVSQSLAWRDSVFADSRYADISVLYEFPTGRRVVLPLARHRHWPVRGGAIASWPRAWGVGGPVCQDGVITPAEAAAVLRHVAGLGALVTEIQLRHGAGHGAWPAAAAGFRAAEQTCHVLDLGGGFARVWQERFRGSARTAVRKAQRSGLVVEVGRKGELIGDFRELYLKSIQRWAARQHEPLWLSRQRVLRATSAAMLTEVAEQFGENFTIWVARSQGTAVAAIIVLRSGGFAKYWRGAMDAALASRVRANDLLHQLAIEEACRDGYQFYDMGMSAPGSPLAAFKEKLGAVPQVSAVLRAERLPLYASERMARELAKRLIGFRDG
jgi:Acetyltransferase (GNAT) domain